MKYIAFNLVKSLVLGAEAVSESNLSSVPIFRKFIIKTKFGSAFKLIGIKLTSADIARWTGLNITKQTWGSSSCM